MSRLIQCNSQDFNMYYSETILIYEGKPYMCGYAYAEREVDDDEEYEEPVEEGYYDVSLIDGDVVSVQDCSVKFLPPMYTSRGVWVGSHTSRSYKRAPRANDWALADYKERLRGIEPFEFDGVKGRIGFEFFAGSSIGQDGVIVYHKGVIVGFFVVDTFYIRGDDIVERLTSIFQDKGATYAIQSI